MINVLGSINLNLVITVNMKPTTKKHSFSIVIPCFNEEKYIGSCIKSILVQNYDSSLIEIIIIDGESEDGSLNIIKNLQQDFPNVKLFSNPSKKTAISLNIGIKNSMSEVIIILGAHTVLDKNFIFYNNKILNEQKVVACGGTQLNIGDTYIQKVIGLTMESPFAMASSSYRWSKNEQYVDTVVYAAYKRYLFDDVGYFEEDYTISEDAEFNWRIRKAGYKIYYSPKIITYYYPRKTIGKFLKQMFKYGILRVNVQKKHIDSIKIMHLIPPIFVMSLILFVILLIANVIDINVIIIILLLYFGLNIIVSSTSVSSKKLKYLIFIPILTFLLHFFWGIGFLAGLVLPRSKKM